MIPISYEEVARQLYHDSDTGKLFFKIAVGRKKPGQEAGAPNSKGYLQVWINGNKYGVAHIIWFLHYKEWPDKQIDHINRVRTDNRICNLRCVTSLENQRNRSIYTTNKSGHPGVWFSIERGMYLVHFRSKYIGQYITLREAIAARINAERNE